MSETIYVTSTEPGCGQTLVGLAILRIIRRNFPYFDYYRTVAPLETGSLKSETAIQNMLNHDEKHEYGLSYQKAMKLTDQGVILDQLTSHLKQWIIDHPKTFHVVEGSHIETSKKRLRLPFNLEIARQVDANVVIVIPAKDKTLNAIKKTMMEVIHHCKRYDIKVIGIIINRVVSVQITALKSLLSELEQAYIDLVTMVPEHHELNHPTVADVFQSLNAKLLFGHDHATCTMSRYVLGAKYPKSFLESNYPHKKTLIVTPYDRMDLLMSTLIAHQSSHYPNIAGILLTSGNELNATIKKILSGMPDLIPIGIVKKSSMDVLKQIENQKIDKAAFHPSFIENALDHLLNHIQESPLIQSITFPDFARLPSIHMVFHQYIKQIGENSANIGLLHQDWPAIFDGLKKCVKLKNIQYTLFTQNNHVYHLLKKSELPSTQQTLVNTKDPQQLLSILPKHHRSLYDYDYLSNPLNCITQALKQDTLDGAVIGNPYHYEQLKQMLGIHSANQQLIIFATVTHLFVLATSDRLQDSVLQNMLSVAKKLDLPHQSIGLVTQQKQGSQNHPSQLQGLHFDHHESLDTLFNIISEANFHRPPKTVLHYIEGSDHWQQVRAFCQDQPGFIIGPILQTPKPVIYLPHIKEAKHVSRTILAVLKLHMSNTESSQ
jgi:BioD-like phosphotransacetylase family protein